MLYVISSDGTMVAVSDCVIVRLSDDDAQDILAMSDTRRWEYARTSGVPIPHTD